MRKKISIFCLFSMFLNIMPCFAIEDISMQNINSLVKKLPECEYRQKTVLKKYYPLDVVITNNNAKAVLLSSNTEVDLVLKDGSILKSESRRNLYRHSRKRDMGRYYGIAIPGALIAGGVTGITFGLGAPLGAAIFIGMCLPVDKAVRTNVKISQDLFKGAQLPIRLEPEKTYNVRMLIPQYAEIKQIVISNTSFDMKKMYEIRIPVEAL